MRITEVRVYKHQLDVLGGRYKMSISAVEQLDSTVVALVTDEGIIGYGEVTPLGSSYQPEHALGARAAIEEMAPHLIGLDVRRTSLVYRVMDNVLNGHNYAKCAIDVACWDATGKAYDERLCDVLGGTDRRAVRSYYGVMPASAAKTAESAKRRQSEGYTRLQIKAGGRPLSEDIEAVRAVAAEVDPTTKLLVDPNRGWTGRDTIEFSIACRDIPLSIEQPCRTYSEHKALVGKIHHPLFLDESTTDVSTVIDAITDGIAQGFGMKLSRVGGITPLRVIRDICIHRGIPLTIDDTWGGDITAAATVHMGATVPHHIYEGTWIAQPYTSKSYACLTAPVRPKNGKIPIPKGPGLGVEPDLHAWGEPFATYG
jgi:L-alanine-DL-glutamate epimerase-like enolase superfamily enzyme